MAGQDRERPRAAKRAPHAGSHGRRGRRPDDRARTGDLRRRARRGPEAVVRERGQAAVRRRLRAHVAERVHADRRLLRQRGAEAAAGDRGGRRARGPRQGARHTEERDGRRPRSLAGAAPEVEGRLRGVARRPRRDRRADRLDLCEQSPPLDRLAAPGSDAVRAHDEPAHRRDLQVAEGRLAARNGHDLVAARSTGSIPSRRTSTS